MLPLPTQNASVRVPKPKHNAAYWARVTKGFDFSTEDKVDPVAFNRILWQGMKGKSNLPWRCQSRSNASVVQKGVEDRCRQTG